MFQLSWKHYLAYLVTEELVGSNAAKGYADEVYTGNILRVYTKSHFLDHVMRDTDGTSKKSCTTNSFASITLSMLFRTTRPMWRSLHPMTALPREKVGFNSRGNE
jgi:hypothetical protein